MGLEQFRLQWDDQEFAMSFARLDEKNIFGIIERMKGRERHEDQWRGTRRIILKGAVLVIVGLEVLRIFVTDSREPPAQSVSFMLEMAALFGLYMVDKARAKWAEPKGLTHLEFLRDKFRRLEKNIYFDRWSSVMLSVAVVDLGLYAAPIRSTVLRVACWGATAAAVCALQFYDQHKINQLKPYLFCFKTMLAGITSMVDETKTMVGNIKTFAKRQRPWSKPQKYLRRGKDHGRSHKNISEDAKTLVEAIKIFAKRQRPWSET
jgi:hypothetical protein